MQTLLGGLQGKIGDSSVSDFLKEGAIELGGSHGVREKAGFVFKDLNQPDDYPENEFICYSLFCALGIKNLIAETICIDEKGKFFPINQSALAFWSDSSLHGRFPALRLVKEEGEKRRIQVSKKVGKETLEDFIKLTPILDLLCEEADKKKLGIECLKSIVKGQRERRDAFKKITPENYGWHFIMTLLLSLGDAKAANYVIGDKGQLIAIDNEMILRDAVVYYTARGPLCGLQSVLLFPSFREKFVAGNPQTVAPEVKTKIKIHITPEEIFNVLDLLMNPPPSRSDKRFKMLDSKESVLYIWCKKILEYNDTYKFLDSYNSIQRSKSREELWWKLFEFSNRWNKIAEKLKTDVSYDDLFKELHPTLFNCYKKAEEEQEKNPYNACQHLIYHQLASGLKHKGKEKLRRKLCAEFFEKLDESAKKHLEGLAKQIPLAQFILGLFHEKANLTKSIELYISAAQEDRCFYAQNCLCEILSSENASRDKDKEKIDNFLARIEDSTQNSQFLYLRGQKYENEDNRDKAIACYKKSADMPNLCAKDRTGNYHAQHRLGQIYEEKGDISKAYEFYKLAADTGHWMAQLKIFEFWERGKGTDEEYKKLDIKPRDACICLIGAAQQGNYKAQYIMYDRLMHDMEFFLKGFLEESNESRSYNFTPLNKLRKIVKKYLASNKQQFNDLKKEAFEWLKKSAINPENKSKCAKTEFSNLCYKSGIEYKEKQDYENATHFFEESQSFGNFKAHLANWKMHQTIWRKTKNNFTEVEKLAKRGNCFAQLTLGSWYRNGNKKLAMKADKEKAISWWIRSADQSCYSAWQNLAKMSPKDITASRAARYAKTEKEDLIAILNNTKIDRRENYKINSENKTLRIENRNSVLDAIFENYIAEAKTKYHDSQTRRELEQQLEKTRKIREINDICSLEFLEASAHKLIIEEILERKYQQTRNLQPTHSEDIKVSKSNMKGKKDILSRYKIEAKNMKFEEEKTEKLIELIGAKKYEEFMEREFLPNSLRIVKANALEQEILDVLRSREEDLLIIMHTSKYKDEIIKILFKIKPLADRKKQILERLKSKQTVCQKGRLIPFGQLGFKINNNKPSRLASKEEDALIKEDTKRTKIIFQNIGSSICLEMVAKM